jgi:hypothetical protein
LTQEAEALQGNARSGRGQQAEPAVLAGGVLPDLDLVTDLRVGGAHRHARAERDEDDHRGEHDRMSRIHGRSAQA